MSNSGIFAIGVFVTLLLGGGLCFTIYEMRRIYRESIDTAERSKTAVKH
jgi:CHASE3 domain sensor protein